MKKNEVEGKWTAGIIFVVKGRELLWVTRGIYASDWGFAGTWAQCDICLAQQWWSPPMVSHRLKSYLELNFSVKDLLRLQLDPHGTSLNEFGRLSPSRNDCLCITWGDFHGSSQICHCHLCIVFFAGIGRAHLVYLGPEDSTFESFKIPDMKNLDCESDLNRRLAHHLLGHNSLEKRQNWNMLEPWDFQMEVRPKFFIVMQKVTQKNCWTPRLDFGGNMSGWRVSHTAYKPHEKWSRSQKVGMSKDLPVILFHQWQALVTTAKNNPALSGICQCIKRFLIGLT